MYDTIERAKEPGCKHQFDDEPNCTPLLFNRYHCDDCDASWSDEWSCACDDDCPRCGKAFSPHDSEPIARCACEHLPS
jgi:hypothetical protein